MINWDEMDPRKIKKFMLTDENLEVIATNHDPEEIAPIWKTIMEETFGYKSYEFFDYTFKNGDTLHLTMARSFPHDGFIISLTQTEDEIKARINNGEHDSCCWRMIGSRTDPISKSNNFFERFYTIHPGRDDERSLEIIGIAAKEE